MYNVITKTKTKTNTKRTICIFIHDYGLQGTRSDPGTGLVTTMRRLEHRYFLFFFICSSKKELKNNHEQKSMKSLGKP